MGQITYAVAPTGAYFIDVQIGTFEVRVMVDLGLTDPAGQIGFALAPDVFDRLEQARQLSRFRGRISRDASGQYSTIESAESTACPLDPASRQPVGPRARIFVSRGAVRVPNRVGVAFFHQLRGCRVIWELDSRIWRIEYP